VKCDMGEMCVSMVVPRVPTRNDWEGGYRGSQGRVMVVVVMVVVVIMVNMY
jgi:hypothetical protein